PAPTDCYCERRGEGYALWPRSWPGTDPLPSRRVSRRFTEELPVTNHASRQPAYPSCAGFRTPSHNFLVGASSSAVSSGRGLPEEIVAKLRQVDVLVSQGRNTAIFSPA